MRGVPVWDLPTRLFHWLLAGLLAVAAILALALEDHSLLFPYHALAGLALAGLIVLRLLWGVVGSRYARFSTLRFGPFALTEYLKSAITGRGPAYVGHNPATAWAMLAMLLIMSGLAVTGVLLGHGHEGVKDVHEVLAYAMLAVAGVHIAGVVLHTIRRRENLTAGIIHGRKQARDSDAIRSVRPVAALAFLALAGGWIAALLAGYDTSTRTARVPVLGALQIGENEKSERGANAPAGGHHDED